MQTSSLWWTLMVVSSAADDVLTTAAVGAACWAVACGAWVEGACVAAAGCCGVVHPAAMARRMTSTATSVTYPWIFMMLNAEDSLILVTIMIGGSPSLPAGPGA